MGRRGEHGLELIKEMAIEAAEKLVMAGGIDELRTRKVAAAIGYTPGTLYLVFKDLNDLVLQMNGRTLDKLNAALAAAAEGKKDDLKAIQAICRAYLAFAETQPALWSLLFERHWGEGFERPDWYQAKKVDCFKPLAERIQSLGIASSPKEVAELTRTLWASIHGTCVLREDDKLAQAGAAESAKLLDLQVDLLLRGAMAKAGAKAAK
jgi:AcrR family transcriptional regulator